MAGAPDPEELLRPGAFANASTLIHAVTASRPATMRKGR